MFTFYFISLQSEVSLNVRATTQGKKKSRGGREDSLSVSRLSGDIRKIVPVIGRYCLFMADGVR